MLAAVHLKDGGGPLFVGAGSNNCNCLTILYSESVLGALHNAWWTAVDTTATAVLLCASACKPGLPSCHVSMASDTGPELFCSLMSLALVS